MVMIFLNYFLLRNETEPNYPKSILEFLPLEYPIGPRSVQRVTMNSFLKALRYS